MRSFASSVLFLLLLVGGLRAQDDLPSEIRDLRKRIDAVLAESRGLAGENEALRLHSHQQNAELETMMDALLLDAGATTVVSEANPIRVFGDFRVRLGYTKNRDFGNQDNGIALPPVLLSPILGQGGGSEEDDEGSYLSAHFLLGLDYHFSRRVMTRFSILAQGLFFNEDTPSSRSAAAGGLGGGATGGTILGQPSVLLTDLYLYEAFIVFEDVFEIDNLDVKTGRQELVFGNEFIFGNNGFFSGETHDALRVDWRHDEWQVTAVMAKNDVAESIRPANHPYPLSTSDRGYDDDELYMLYVSWEASPEFNLDLYWVFWNGNGGGSVGSLGNGIPSFSTGDDLEDSPFLRAFFHTLGLRFSGLVDDFDYNLEFAWQTGHIDSFVIEDVSGIAVEFELGFTVHRDAEARVYLRGLYSEGAHGDESGFIPLFPERHSYHDPKNLRSGARYGLMDIIPMDNVITLQAGFGFDPADDWRLGFAVLWATHDADLRPFAAKEDDIGWEIDLYANYRHSEETTIGFGFGLFLPDEGAPFVGGSFIGPDGKDDPTFLAYLDLRVLF